MIHTIKKLLIKYKEMILYLVFGGLTTALNIGTYALCYYMIHIPNAPADIIAWIVGVVFAFVTNKLFVFESKSLKADVLVKEAVSFVGCRAATGVLDLVIMILSVNVFHQNELLWKIIANIIVIILNYVASKLLIFRKKSTQTTEE